MDKQEYPPQIKQVFELLPDIDCIAMDSDGVWYIYEGKPALDEAAGYWRSSFCHTKVNLGDYKAEHWNESKIMREDVGEQWD